MRNRLGVTARGDRGEATRSARHVAVAELDLDSVGRVIVELDDSGSYTVWECDDVPTPRSPALILRRVIGDELPRFEEVPLD